jgi:hypothetical protein
LKKVLCIAAFAGILAAASIFAFVVYAWFIGDSYTSRSDVPVANQALTKLADPKLPPGATDIYYIDHVEGLQTLQRFIRFRVPKEQIEVSIDRLIDDANRQSKRILVYDKVPLPKSDIPSPRGALAPAPWWQPGAIQVGFYRGETDSYALQVWADSDSGTVYVYQTD